MSEVKKETVTKYTIKGTYNSMEIEHIKNSPTIKVSGCEFPIRDLYRVLTEIIPMKIFVDMLFDEFATKKENERTKGEKK